MFKLKINKEKGITLIALVVTIIVLLILAGISIQMLSGDNGILTRAGDAKTMTDEAQIREKIQLAYHAALAGGQGTYTKESLKDEMEKEFGNDYEVDDSDNNNWVLIAEGQSVTIPAGKKVEGKVVGSSSDWKLNEAKDTIVAYVGENITGDTFVIPNYVDDNKIISVGNGSAPIWAEKFSNPNDFMNGKKIKITEGIENIKYNAFVSSLGLIGDLILPESIVSIESYAFAGCTNMNGKLYIGKNVPSIGSAAFGSDTFSTIEIQMKDIPDIFIDRFMVDYTGVQSITIGNNVQTIGKYAFQNCNNITTLTIPANVITIGENAFKGIDKNKITNNSSAEGYPWGAE